jgi:RNA polymerase sigma-70 factor (ECF subfamily)
LAYLARRAHGHDQAADLLAETYLIAWRKLDQVPEGEEGRLWLFGVARNVLKKQAHHQHLQADLTKRLEQELRVVAAASEPSDGPWSEKLRRAISDLPDKEREILLLTAWEGLAPREIAAITGSSANAVRVRLVRARSRLRPELQAHQQAALRDSTATDLPHASPTETAS